VDPLFWKIEYAILGFCGPKGFYFGLRFAGLYARLAVFIRRLLWIFLYLRTIYIYIYIYMYIYMCIGQYVKYLDNLLARASRQPKTESKIKIQNGKWKRFCLYFVITVVFLKCFDFLFSLAFRVYFSIGYFYSWIGLFLLSLVLLLFFRACLCEFH